MSFLKISFLTAVLVSSSAFALDLDWSGQFRSEVDWVSNYTMNNHDGAEFRNAAQDTSGGYYVPGGGTKGAHFQSVFLRLKPKVVVNDNVYLKSEWWVGNPIYGFMGSAVPYAAENRNYDSTFSRGSSITAQRLWGEFLTDIGTLQVGRAPLHWGLGVVWNNGDGLWDRYQSTGDVIRMVSKFGAFSFTPSVVKYSMGNNIGGACNSPTGTCSGNVGSSGVNDYSMMLKYENTDEEFEGGVNFIRHIVGSAQDTTNGYLGVTQISSGSNYTMWDVSVRKRLGKFSLAAEVPFVSGDVGGISYKTYAIATEANFKISDVWESHLKAGIAPGQAGNTDKFKAFYFHPNYKIGLIMFNYALTNFAGPNSQNNPAVGEGNLVSPYYNPIVNAKYLNWGIAAQTGKWNLHTNFIYARANETAAATGSFYNHTKRTFYANGNGRAQEGSLGWEMDYGATFQWDDVFQFGTDFGFFFPGSFYKFSNLASDNNTSTVFATVLKVGVSF